MWKKQKIWLSNKNKIKKWIKEKKAVDVVLFGSLVRGKVKPNDLDLCIILKKEQEIDSLELIDSLVKTLKGEIKIQINSLTENAFIKGNSLVKTLLVEGFSVKHNRDLAEIYGFKPKVLFFYELKNFKSSDKVRFHYLLRGRYGQKGLLDNHGAKLIKDGLIEAPVSAEEVFKEVLNTWKVEFQIERVLSSS